MLKFVSLYFFGVLAFPLFGLQKPVPPCNNVPISFAIPPNYYFSILPKDILGILKSYLHTPASNQIYRTSRQALKLLPLWSLTQMKNGDSNKLFQWAYELSYWDAALFLLAQGANPNNKSERAHSDFALTQAVRDNHATAVEALIKAGATLPLYTAFYLHHPLYIAAESNFFLIAKLLLEAGIKCYSKKGSIKNKLINTAVKNGALETLQLFLAHSPQGSKKLNKWWVTALDSGQERIIKFLMENKGMPISQRLREGNGEYPLEVVVKRSYAAATRVLLAAGADPNRTSQTGVASTLLYHATKNNNPAIVKLLLESGALPDCGEGEHPLFIAGYKGYQEVAQSLLQHCKQIDPVDEALESPLEVAISFRHCGIAQMLLDAGANPNRVSPRSSGALGNCIRELTMSWNPDPKEEYKVMLVAVLEKMHKGPYAQPNLMKYLEDLHEKWCECSRQNSIRTSSCILFNYLPYLKRKFNG